MEILAVVRAAALDSSMAGVGLLNVCFGVGAYTGLSKSHI